MINSRLNNQSNKWTHWLIMHGVGVIRKQQLAASIMLLWSVLMLLACGSVWEFCVRITLKKPPHSISFLFLDKVIKRKLEIRKLSHATLVRKEYLCLLISTEGLYIKPVTFFSLKRPFAPASRISPNDFSSS